MALVSSLVLPVLSPAVGQSYSVSDALIHGACLFIAGTVLFSLACCYQPCSTTCGVRRSSSSAERPGQGEAEGREGDRPRARGLYLGHCARGGARAALRFDAWA